MRELKFRAWDGGRGIMVKDGDDMLNATQLKCNDDGVLILDSPILTFMQFTGLADKNGVEIYEGDIVRVVTNHIADLAPKHPETESVVEVRCEDAVWWFGDMTMVYQPLKNAKIEVIGNIYENPELLATEATT